MRLALKHPLQPRRCSSVKNAKVLRRRVIAATMSTAVLVIHPQFNHLHFLALGQRQLITTRESQS